MKKIFLSLGLALSTLNHSALAFYTDSTPQLEIPEIGSGVGFIDQQKEKFIGEKVYREVHRQLPILLDPWLEDQFSQVFSQILGQTQLGQPVGLVVVKDPQINAFAVPGGLFALNTGMVTSAKNMDEVVGVMAHEIAHVTQRHYSRSQEAFKGQGLLALAGILVGAAVAAKGDGDIGGAVMMGTQAAMMDRQLNYSRNQEREADRIGMQFMSGAGYNPQAMADFFETMNRSRSFVSYMPDFWLTHPLTSERMSEARLRANQFPKVAYSRSQAEFDVIKWYAAVLTNQSNERELQILVNQNKYAGMLALATFYLQQGDYDKAQQQLDKAKQLNAEHTLFVLLQTELYLQQNKVDAAYNTVIAKQRIAPESRALSLKLAKVYVHQNQPQQAEKLANRFIQKNDRDIVAWQILQQAANLETTNPMRTVNVLRNRAEVEYWSGAEDSAIKSLLHAQRLSKDNQSMSAKIESRLKTMQSERQMKI
ncbi:putative Zn-dependent protease [Acinetobacter calcoaceticus]|uniref:Putative beta-barrel assembly-enhancing protease n=1 Tax=Acinetobacter calcoaceticus TaxID=471 RepID=A0A4R1XA21_ACICA|nr:putative Zn-dependent protease [Acinetobacter calcoaceticus]